jgi:hypothetical protein
MSVIEELNDFNEADQDEILRKLFSQDGDLGLRGITQQSVDHPTMKAKSSLFDVTQRGENQFPLQVKHVGQWVGEEGLMQLSQI